MSGYTIINLQSDAAAWAKSANDALTSNDPLVVEKAWTDLAINSAKITSGMAELAANDPKWAKLLGGVATIESVHQSALRIEADLQATNGFNNVKAGDVLSVVGGISDLVGNALVKPGPQLVAGLILKGVGTGAGIAQNVVGDQTIGAVGLLSSANTLAKKNCHRLCHPWAGQKAPKLPKTRKVCCRSSVTAKSLMGLI